MRVSKWGNSLAVRLPKALVEEMGLIDGDTVNLAKAGSRDIAVEKIERRKAALERLLQLNLKLPEDYKFNREEANGR